MNTKYYKQAVVLSAALALLVPGSFAEDSSRELSEGEEKVADKIEAQFIDFAGEDTETLVESLRTGEELSYVIEVEQPVFDDEGNPVLVEVVNEDGSVSEVPLTELVEETVVVENAAGPLGFGGVVLAMGLAEATLPDGSSYEDIVKALFDEETGEGILDMRADGMGWGKIYQSYDLKVGEIMSAKNSARPDKVTPAARAAKPEKAARPDKIAKVDRPEKPEKPEKPAKPEKPEKPEKPAKPEKARNA